MIFYIQNNELMVLPQGSELPKEPNKSHYEEIDLYFSDMEVYKDQLSSLRSKAIKVENKDEAMKWIIENNMDDGVLLIGEGEFYSLPDEGFKMDVKNLCECSDDMTLPCALNAKHCKKRQVAIIKPIPTPDQQSKRVKSFKDCKNDVARKWGHADWASALNAVQMRTIGFNQIDAILYEAAELVCSKHESTIKELTEALEWFCGRVEKGEVRSKNTYEKFKSLIAKYASQSSVTKQPEEDQEELDSMWLEVVVEARNNYMNPVQRLSKQFTIQRKQ